MYLSLHLKFGKKEGVKVSENIIEWQLYLREDWTSLAAEVVEVDDKEEVVDNESWAGVEPRLGLRGRSPT